MTDAQTFENVYLSNTEVNSLWNITCCQGKISSISPSLSDTPSDRLLAPSLCHAHIHLDKPYLLSHPSYSDLLPETGSFAEALRITSEAKKRFSHLDLVERGRTLIQESINFGVTHLRAFVEVDPVVELKCLKAGIALKKEFRKRCEVQLVVFAQDAVFSYEDGGTAMRSLLEEAVGMEEVDVVGSTPYVEDGDENARQNIEWIIKLAMRRRKHLDFHIDYNLALTQPPLVPITCKLLKNLEWQTDKTVVFGHCTRLTLFRDEEWKALQQVTKELPISFVGLPTSDLFMMGRIAGDDRVRGTLQILSMVKKYGFNAVIAVNNVGNAFTPHGSCDPLALAGFCVGVYQAGTLADAEILYQCVSSRAKAAIGLSIQQPLNSSLKVGDTADFVVFGGQKISGFRVRKTTTDLVYDGGRERQTYFGGRMVSD